VRASTGADARLVNRLYDRIAMTGQEFKQHRILFVDPTQAGMVYHHRHSAISRYCLFDSKRLRVQEPVERSFLAGSHCIGFLADHSVRRIRTSFTERA